jgi:RND family efflux transporter MFP subunit
MAGSQLNIDLAPVTAVSGDEIRRLLDSEEPAPRRPILPILLTLAAILIAAPLSWATWHVYMASPWTRDGTVRAYVDVMAPEVEGRIVALPVHDNQYVHKGDLLVQIDPINYEIAVKLAEATVRQDQEDLTNLQREAARRRELSGLAVTLEQQQTSATAAQVAAATLQEAQARLEQAQVNLQRTQIRSPVNGWVTNLLTQQGDYAKVGASLVSVVDADSYWIDGYFEETSLGAIHDSDPARIKLLGFTPVLAGHVASIAHAIDVPNAQPSELGLATVNPIFTWVRLAQRVPVRIHIDHVPAGVQLVAGMTATVEIDPPARREASTPAGPDL